MLNTLKENPFTPIAVVQLDLEGNYINEYPDINKAAYKTTTCESSISNCLSGKQLSTKRHIWMRKELYKKEKNYSLKWLKKKKEFLKSKI